MEKYRQGNGNDDQINDRQRKQPPNSTTKINFEPTPIGPSGVAAVPNLPLEHALMSSDLSQINFLQQLFQPTAMQQQMFQPHMQHHFHQQQHQQNHHAFASAANRDPIAPMVFPTHLPSASLSLNSASFPSSEQQQQQASDAKIKYGPRHIEQWNVRFKELVEFQKAHGHCLVPMYDHHSPKLSNWVKRQRNQYRLKMEGKHSTLCDKRQKALEDLGFVWDSHAACWEERYKELYQFWREYGHSKVPKSYKKNPSLSVWVKCQRRQFKLLRAGKPSYISEDRIRMLKALDFDFNPRKETTCYSDEAKAKQLQNR
eukprot:scaffold2068_cov96-Cylindrotheca_fusiformis.AAC.11